MGDDQATSFTVRRLTAEQTHPLRHAVLRSGRPIEECDFPGDRDPDTFHAGAELDGRIVSVASMYHEARPSDAPGGADRADDHDAGTAWRLRGMATEPGLQRSGAGSAALQACSEHAIAHGATLLWCNARTPAIGFYERHGWVVLGHEFDVPTAGPHYVMERRVG